MKTIILYGLRRSGNHFLISTILNNFENFVHMNDIKLSYEQYLKYKETEITQNTSNRCYTGFKNTECVLLSLENKNINFNEIEKFNNINDCHIILLLRSPYTNLSSTWKVTTKNKIKTIKVLKLWEDYANLFLQENNLIKVFYDELSSNDKYRNNILNKLNIQHKNINKYSSIYQKSSFNKSSQKSQIYKNLNNCIYNNDEEFCNLFINTNIESLYNQILKLFKN